MNYYDLLNHFVLYSAIPIPNGVSTQIIDYFPTMDLCLGAEIAIQMSNDYLELDLYCKKYVLETVVY